MDCIHNVNAETESLVNRAHVTLEPPKVSDNSESAGEPGAAVHVTSELDFPIGVTYVQFTATDNAGNMARCSMEVSVEAHGSNLSVYGRVRFRFVRMRFEKKKFCLDRDGVDSIGGRSFLPCRTIWSCEEVWGGRREEWGRLSNMAK